MNQSFINLETVPQWARNDLFNDIRLETEYKNLHIEMPSLHTNQLIHSDLPGELIIKRTGAVLVTLIPFIYDWLVKRRIMCDIKNENGNTAILLYAYYIDLTIQSIEYE